MASLQENAIYEKKKNHIISTHMEKALYIYIDLCEDILYYCTRLIQMARWDVFAFLAKRFELLFLAFKKND